MTENYNAPHYTLAAVKRIYDDLPDLVGRDEWGTLRPQIDEHIAQLEAQPNNLLAATQLRSLLWPHTAANQRLTGEMQVQEVISRNIAGPLRDIASSLGFDPDTVDGLSAAAYARLEWEADPATIPAPDDDLSQRTVTFNQGPVGEAKSVKLKNMRLDLGDFTQIAAGFVTTGFDILDKPHPLLIAAGILLTVNALHGAMKIELSEQEASVFWGMIQAGERDLTEAAILTATNAEREKYGLPALNDTQLRHSLSRLAQIKSIAQTGDTYRIIEKYTVKD